MQLIKKSFAYLLRALFMCIFLNMPQAAGQGASHPRQRLADDGWKSRSGKTNAEPARVDSECDALRLVLRNTSCVNYK